MTPAGPPKFYLWAFRIAGLKFSSAKTMAPPAIMSLEEGGVNIPLSGLLTVVNDPSVQASTGLMLNSDIHWSIVEIKVPSGLGS